MDHDSKLCPKNIESGTSPIPSSNSHNNHADHKGKSFKRPAQEKNTQVLKRASNTNTSKGFSQVSSKFSNEHKRK